MTEICLSFTGSSHFDDFTVLTEKYLKSREALARLEGNTAARVLEIREKVARIHTEGSKSTPEMVRFRSSLEEAVVDLSEVLISRAKLTALFLANLVQLFHDTGGGIILLLKSYCGRVSVEKPCVM